MKTRGLLLLTLAFLPAMLPAQPVPAPKMFAVRLTTGPAWDATKSPNEQAGMREHSANIARIRREGLLVLRVPDEAAVQAQFAPDPTVSAGVFKLQVDVFAPFAHGNTAYLTTPEAVLLRAYLDAFNRHEADAVTALCATGLKWFSLQGESFELVEGRAPLHEWLTSYFGNYPTARSEFLSLEQTGPILTIRERATWESKEGRRESLQSIGVYEIRDGLIQRVWYYPSVKDAPPPTAK